MKSLTIIALGIMFNFLISNTVNAQTTVETKNIPKENVKSEADELVEGDEMPEFPGGLVALNKYRAVNMKYPQIAIENDLQGKCYLRFVVNEIGEISNVRVVKGVSNCAECDQEAVRLIETMPIWKPGKKNGKEAKSEMQLTINFKLY